MVDLAHEALQEDHLGQTDGQCPQVARERIQVVEVMQLHRVREVQREVLEVGALCGELVKPWCSDEVTWQLNVSQCAVETRVDEVGEQLRAVHVEIGVLRSQRDTHPQARVVREQAPFLAHRRDLSELALLEVREDVQQEFVGKFVNGFLQR